MNVGFASRSSLNNLPGWAETLELPIPERIERLQRSEVRAAMEAGARHTERDLRRRHLVQFENYVVGDTWSTLNDGCAGRTIGDIARQRNARPFDVLLDIACADALRTVLWPVRQEDDDDTWSLRAKVWNDPRVVLGGSDAGAHLDRQCGASYTTRFLADVLRGRRLLSLERAVQLITDVPARLFGLRGRGRIERGRRADLVLFDPAEIDAGRPSLAQDFPGGSPRMTAGAAGISRVFVAGVETVRDGRSTGATPGSILRSGRDTATVLMRQPPATGSVTR
jgi:N-acyl-D-aspartate/D-glutamate deacylase